MRHLNSLHHRGVIFSNLLGCFHSLLLERQRCVEIFLTICLNGIRGVCSFLSHSFVLSDSSGDNFGCTSFFFDLCGFDLYFFRCLDKHRLFSLKFSLHNTDGTFCLNQTVVTICVSVSESFYFLSFFFEQNLESGN
jgi:hypothetical protein